MRDLEHMELLESTRMLAPGPERLDLLEQIAALRIKLAAIAAKRKLLQSAKLHLAALVRANDSRMGIGQSYSAKTKNRAGSKGEQF
jgi:hypothetical protein